MLQNVAENIEWNVGTVLNDMFYNKFSMQSLSKKKT